MANRFLRLGVRDRRDILNQAARELGRAAQVLEKDIWVCWALRELFRLPLREDLAFKGGTSLSKVYGVIDRFSEDVDVTLSYRSQITDAEIDATPSKTKRKKLSDELRTAAVNRVAKEIYPALRDALARETGSGDAVRILPGGEAIRIGYPSVLEGPGPGYLSEGVLLEFGGRNAVIPAEERKVRADLAPLYPQLEFPEAEVRILAAARTFWEKLTLIHADLGRESGPANAERRSRHLYDVFKLRGSAVGAAALADQELLADVVRIKNAFYYTAWADYDACLSGGFRLRPMGPHEDTYREDYEAMTAARMIHGEPPGFDAILATLGELQEELRRVVPEAEPAGDPTAEIDGDP